MNILSKNHENSVLWTVDNRKMDSREMNFILGSEASLQRNNLICPNIIEFFFMYNNMTKRDKQYYVYYIIMGVILLDHFIVSIWSRIFYIYKFHQIFWMLFCKNGFVCFNWKLYLIILNIIIYSYIKLY